MTKRIDFIIILAMIKLLIVRHAKTAWNVMGRIQGQSDIPLLPESIINTKNTADSLKNIPIDKVYSSPLVRAKSTAEFLVEGRDLPVECDARLCERNFGEYDGKTYDEIGLTEHDKLFYALENVDSAESSEDTFLRVRGFVNDLKAKDEGKTVLIVSHGVCISYLIYALNHDRYNPDDYKMNYIKNLTVYEAEL